MAGGDSDDEFELIQIKQKVKEFRTASQADRIPPHLINEAVRWRLNRNDCQNRGYVLDGYPKNAQSAQDVFVITPEKAVKKDKAEGSDEEEAEPVEEEEGEALKPVLQKNIYPESVVSLNATELFLRRRSNSLQAQAISEAMKWHTSKLVEKLAGYNAANSINLFKHPDECNCIYPTQKFFQDNKTEIFEMDAEGDKYEMFESMRIYIERFGRPYNYLKSVKELNEEREQHLIEEERETKAAAEHGSAQDEAQLEAQKAALEKMFEQRLKHVNIHMTELTECDDLNMRQFLMKYIIPVLTEGMIDVWKMGPLDPVDYLADYIFKRSNGT
jgi:adenylate kinase